MFTKANKIILTAVMCFLVCVNATKVFGATLYVNSPDCNEFSGNPAYCTVQAAVNSASSGDTISIAAGTFASADITDKSLILEGTSATSSIIDGGNTDTVISISNTAAMSLTLRNLTIQNGLGSGIAAPGNEVTLTVENCLIQNNATTGSGGGINFGSSSGTLSVSSSLIYNNTADRGAGIYIKYSSATANIVNSTISTNNADNGGAAIKSSGLTTLASNTIVNNDSDADDDASSDGGAVYVGVGGVLYLHNSILALNTGLAAAPECTAVGTITTLGYNIIKDITGCSVISITGDQFGVDPVLGSLTANGGPTQTYALLAGSPAIDAGDPAGCTEAAGVDQRGFARPVDGNGDGTAACDIGAYEVGICGDGHMEMSEACDDGNTERGDDCTDVCMIEVCGNGIFDDGEECDDSNLDNNDGCSLICQIEHCGDNITQADEECDDGNVIAGDGCSSLCNNEICGNDVVNAGEECDDGNVIDSDGCSSTCQVESCGDGITQTSEQCDDGNEIETDGCKSSCVISICGDRITDTGEECDDGNTTDNDGCSATCAYEDDQDQDADEDVDQDQDVDEDDTDASTGTSTTDGEVASGSGGDGGGCSLIAAALPMNESALLFVGMLVGLVGLRGRWGS